MARAKRRSDVDYSQTALVEWLMEKPGRFFTLNSNSCLTLYEKLEPNESGKRPIMKVYQSNGARRSEGDDHDAMVTRLGGKSEFSIQKLINLKCLNTYVQLDSKKFEAFADKIDKPNFHWADVVYVPNVNAREWWNTIGKLHLAEMQARIDADRALVDRLIVIGSEVSTMPTYAQKLALKMPEWMRAAMPERKIIKPFAVARVVRETSSRIYIVDIKKLDWRLDSDHVHWSTIKGRRPEQYVEKQSIMADNATLILGKRMLDTVEEFEESSITATIRILEQIVPIVEREDNRIDQSHAQMDDILREMITENQDRLVTAAAKAEDGEAVDADSDFSPNR